MLVEKIISRQNPLVKRFRRVRAMGERQHVFLEGVRLIEDALATGVRFESVAFTADLESSQRGAALLESLARVQCRGAGSSSLDGQHAPGMGTAGECGRGRNHHQLSRQHSKSSMVQDLIRHAV
jgi:hypothetical protein